jgi:replication-associated recombination protein RarA
MLLNVACLQAAITLFRTLEDLLSHHACAFIVGPPSCGKTALWQLLMKTLQKAYIAANKEVTLVPDDVLAAVHVRSEQRLYGAYLESYLA